MYKKVEWLNKDAIANELSQSNKDKLNLEILSLVDSTNTYLLSKSYELTQSNIVTVCVAEEQTKGRGRHDKHWYSPCGRNIYCSFGWQFSALSTNLSQLSLAVAVIILNALQRLEIKQNIQLKWPNDIFYDHKKLGGVLIETKRAQHASCVVIIGIGINTHLPVNNPFASQSSDLETITGDSIRRNKLLGVLIDEMMNKVPLYFEVGFKAFINEWRASDMLQNKFVVTKQGKYEIPGIALGINDQGELILRDAHNELHTFRCGDVSVSLQA